MHKYGYYFTSNTKGQAGFKTLLAYRLNTGLSITDLICYWHPKDRPAEFRRKDGARPALFLFLCCSMYFLFFVVLYIVCVYMCTELLPPGGYPIAVNKYIIPYHTSTSLFCTYYRAQFSDSSSFSTHSWKLICAY